jgi:hypothetical protein
MKTNYFMETILLEVMCSLGFMLGKVSLPGQFVRESTFLQASHVITLSRTTVIIEIKHRLLHFIFSVIKNIFHKNMG